MITRRRLTVFRITCFAITISRAVAQFTPGIVTNDSYWSDGKAEFDIYDAQLMRGGQLRHCEALHIFFREKTDPAISKVVEPKTADGVSVIRMNQLWSAPIGMYLEQASLTAYWRLDALLLARLTLAGTDSFVNVWKKIEQTRTASSTAIALNGESYSTGPITTNISAPGERYFYDELPLRIRTIDWMKPPAEFSIQLLPSLLVASSLEFKPAKVSWKPGEKSFEVTVQHAGGTDHFLLDRDFPYLLREWKMADGSRLKMKRSLKADYWNYNKEGDRERALQNPMLQHPD